MNEAVAQVGMPVWAQNATFPLEGDFGRSGYALSANLMAAVQEVLVEMVLGRRLKGYKATAATAHLEVD
ncbi:MAG: hypothetical protein OEV28_11575 [Nitrospirota bacterium]|nr:hypothetical protein [Nitrospirota bacterium]